MRKGKPRKKTKLVYIKTYLEVKIFCIGKNAISKRQMTYLNKIFATDYKEIICLRYKGLLN